MGNSQCGYSKDKSHLTYLILFYDKMMRLWTRGDTWKPFTLTSAKHSTLFLRKSQV